MSRRDFVYIIIFFNIFHIFAQNVLNNDRNRQIVGDILISCIIVAHMNARNTFGTN